MVQISVDGIISGLFWISKAQISIKTDAGNGFYLDTIPE